MRIAVDAMGGDNAPRVPVRAVQAFVEEHDDVRFALIGDPDAIRQQGFQGHPAVEIVPAGSVIGSGEDPVRAVRRKHDSSLVMAAKMVQAGEADMMISAGNTGALVAAGLLIIGRLQGIDRPALAPVLPTFDGRGVLLLDAGATMDASSRNLVEYAAMGSAYSQLVLGVENPRVCLLNVGTEEGKGNSVTKEAFALLEQAPLHFLGNVEARDMLDGRCDVVVCDGFVGNVVLKMLEGAGIGIMQMLKGAMTANWKTKLAASVLKPSLKSFWQRYDYMEYGGSPFLGVAGGCLKVHGSGNERAWYRAFEQSIRFVEERLLEKISALF
ncbi:MAG: phosphate acyltransferase PlsX [Alicyclobacillus sp.]|nr:phosphate acyltransferase PlsX [Alicyclobacillus sp.]